MLEDMLRRLEEVERAVNRIPMPLAYAENLYFFREHVDVVRRRLTRRIAESGEPSSEVLTARGEDGVAAVASRRSRRLPGSATGPRVSARARAAGTARGTISTAAGWGRPA